MAPTSTATSVASSHASSFTVSYSVTDPAPSSGIAQVDLYGEFPGQESWHELGYRVDGGLTGSFEILPPGPGTYKFMVVARDNAGNQEYMKNAPDTTTLSIDDNTPPDSLGTVVVYEAITIASADARFDLKVGSTTVAAAAGNGDFGRAFVSPDNVTVSQQGTNYPLDKYTVSIYCTQDGREVANVTGPTAEVPVAAGKIDICTIFDLQKGPIAAPVPTAELANRVTDTTATLRGVVAANYGSTTYHFEWGTADNPHANSTPVGGPVTSQEDTTFANLTGLTPDTTYTYRLVATNEVGTTFSGDATFTTLPAPAPPSPTTTPTNATSTATTTTPVSPTLSSSTPASTTTPRPTITPTPTNRNAQPDVRTSPKARVHRKAKHRKAHRRGHRAHSRHR